jgi:hypothetical protein
MMSPLLLRKNLVQLQEEEMEKQTHKLQADQLCQVVSLKK